MVGFIVLLLENSTNPTFFAVGNGFAGKSFNSFG
jgi:hypothetical protein